MATDHVVIQPSKTGVMGRYEAFLDHYKLSYAEALLKRWNADPKSAPEKTVRVAVQVFQRQVHF